MDWEGKVANVSFTCAVTGRALAPGETCWSALVQNGGEFRRQDFAEDVWLSHDRAGLISWWRQKVPVPAKGKAQVRLDANLLRRLFADLRESGDRDRQCLCYVIALCLVRAREFALAGVAVQDGVPWLSIDDRRERTRLRMRDPRMSDAEQATVQASLLNIIGVGDAQEAAAP